MTKPLTCPLQHKRLEWICIDEGTEEVVYWCAWCGSLLLLPIYSGNGTARIPKGYNETTANTKEVK